MGYLQSVAVIRVARKRLCVHERGHFRGFSVGLTEIRYLSRRGYRMLVLASNQEKIHPEVENLLSWMA